MLPIGNKIWSLRSSCDSHRRAEMSPMGDKSCHVSESFGSSSVASLRTPPTWLPRAGVRARVRMILPAPTALRYVPSFPQSIPRCWVTLIYRQIPIGSVAAKQRVVTACQTRQWRCMGETHVRFVRSFLRHRERSWWVLRSRIPTFAARRPFTHCRTFIQVSRVVLATVRVLLGGAACDSVSAVLRALDHHWIHRH